MPISRSRRFANRRLSYLVLCLVLFAFAFFVLSPAPPVAPPPFETKNDTDSEAGPGSGFKYSINDIKDGIKDTVSKGKDTITNVLNPFRQPSHPPLRQKEDEYKGTSWWADWKWLAVPFSSSVTLDEDRALLPPLPDRPLIFCYYDGTLKKTTSEKNAESGLLLSWRRAWWAHGFRPIIISPSEAMNNAKYNELQRLEIDPDLKNDLMRWLAWESMGAGVLANYTLFPMASTSDSMLTFLRKGEFPKLTMYNSIENGLLIGQESDVDKVLKALLASSSLKSKQSVIDIVGRDAFSIDRTPKGLAYYDSEVIKKYYDPIWQSFSESRTQGLLVLNRLVNSHLHLTWQSQFSEGIEVLQPFPEHTTVMIEPALRLARALGACPQNPIPSSCPPNVWTCAHCKEPTQGALKISTPSQYRNTSRVFSVGTVPHPWTLASLSHLKEKIDVAWIRRKSLRDAWLEEITRDLLGERVSGLTRVLRFKQAVADEGAATRAIWVTPEADIPSDIDWQFGFTMEKTIEDESKEEESKEKEAEDESKESKSTATKRNEKSVDTEGMSDEKDESKGKAGMEKEKEEEEEDNKPMSLEAQKAKEKELFEKAKVVVNLDKLTDETRIRASLEAWNLADTEAWKFARAYLARRRKIRSEWEKEEAKYVGGAGSEKGRNSWSRWRDEKE